MLFRSLERFRPRLIVSEYNEKIPPPLKFVINYDPAFSLRHHFFGYSISKLADLLAKHDYVLLEVEYNNVFIAPRETPGAVGVDLSEAYKAGYLSRPDRLTKFAGNVDMEELLSLTEPDARKFVNKFYAPFSGQYTLD